jgi:hypothetical protein
MRYKLHMPDARRTALPCQSARARHSCHLAFMFPLCSIKGMERIDTSAVAHAILDAPGWARVGITAPSSCLREDAALELARVIADAVDAPVSTPSPEQSTLPL